MPAATARRLAPGARPAAAKAPRAAKAPTSSALIEAVLDIVAERGLAAASLRTVAERAGVSNGLT